MGYYIDCSFSQHLLRLKTIFEKLRAAQLRLNPKKSMFARDNLVFLGFRFSQSGQDLDESRFKKIRDLKLATNVREVKFLLGFLSYYRKHIPGFAILASPIRQLFKQRDDTGKDLVFHWGPEQDESLSKLKQALLTNVLLEFPDINDTFYIQTDASKLALAHCLLQKRDGTLRPIAFGGRAFKKYETKLSATDCELMAILHAIDAYRQFLGNGRKFVILTDHCSLQYLQNLKHATSPKLIRYSLLLQHLNFDIIHVKGKNNTVPDFLSRYQIKQDESEEVETPVPDSLTDVDHYNFLNAMDVEQVIEDFDMIPRDKIPKCKRKYKIYEILPIKRKEKMTIQSTGERSKESRTETKTDCDRL